MIVRFINLYIAISSYGFKGPGSISRYRLASIGNPIEEKRRSYDRLIPTMGFPILIRRHLYIEHCSSSLLCDAKHLVCAMNVFFGLLCEISDCVIYVIFKENKILT